MVNSVQLSSDVYLVCLSHALTTEREEVMGLLLGEVSASHDTASHKFKMWMVHR